MTMTRGLSGTKIYRGEREINGFFLQFMSALPAGAVERFALESLQIDGNLAYITWNVGDDIPLGTDTFFVDTGRSWLFNSSRCTRRRSNDASRVDDVPRDAPVPLTWRLHDAGPGPSRSGSFPLPLSMPSVAACKFVHGRSSKRCILARVSIGGGEVPVRSGGACRR